VQELRNKELIFSIYLERFRFMFKNNEIYRKINRFTFEYIVETRIATVGELFIIEYEIFVRFFGVHTL
jgi:hypothetical protein